MTPALFSLAIDIANQTARGVTDKGGQPYILHPLRIMMRLRTTDLHLMALAVMHDVVEDDTAKATSFTYLRERGFSDEFIADLRLLTHGYGVEYMEYVEDMRFHRRVLLVKEQDLIDNSNITRLRGITEKDVARMIKYQKAFIRVQEMLKEISDGPLRK